jgi:hypothetical protein
LFLDGAALHRCDKGFIFNTGFSHWRSPDTRPDEFFSYL